MTKTLTHEEIKLCWTVQDILYPLYIKMFPEQRSLVMEAKIGASIEEFALIFQEDKGIQAMRDFLQWADDNPEDIEWGQVMSTCMHDINQRNERFMSPRTSGYLKED